MQYIKWWGKLNVKKGVGNLLYNYYWGGGGGALFSYKMGM